MHRKFPNLFLSIILFLGAIFPLSHLTVQADNNQTVTIATDILNVRQGPGLSYPVVDQVKRGQTFSLINKNNDWYEIILSNGQKGWVANWLVSLSQNNSTMKQLKIGVITGDNLRIRKGPGIEYLITGYLSQGVQVNVKEELGDWIKIETSNTKGWVSKDYVKLATKNNSNKPINQDSSSKKTAIINATSLKIRSEGSLNGNIIGSISSGQTVQILEEHNNWFKIVTKSGDTGWVAGWYLTIQSESKSNQGNSNTIKETISILHNGTNIRKSPSVQAKIILRANNGDSFPILSYENDWYEISLPDGSSGFVAGWVVSINKPHQGNHLPNRKGIKGKTIILDAGHGGRDQGTSGVAGTKEKDLTLKTTQLISQKLQSAGANVILTRNSDQYISLPTRVSTAQMKQANAFISIHYDSIMDRNVKGMTTYYYHAFQKTLANAIHTQLSNQIKLKDRGIRFGDYHVIRENTKPAILLELGYLSNPIEEMVVTSNDYQDAITNAIVSGLKDYFE